MALALACTSAALDRLQIDALRASESLAMRAVYLFDSGPAGALGRRALERLLPDDDDADADAPPSVTLVVLTPAAHRRFLLGTTPAPRARLACLILAFAERLEAQVQRKSVIGIDIDITPPDGAEHDMEWRPRDDERGCKDAIQARLAEGTIVTPEVAMAYAIERLAKNRCVVAIAFPREDETARERRDRFMRDVSARAVGGDAATPSCNHVQFAAPDVSFVPHELVWEYPTRVLKGDEIAPSVQRRIGPNAQLPSELCSLGRSLGARLAEVRRTRAAPVDLHKSGAASHGSDAADAKPCRARIEHPDPPDCPASGPPCASALLRELDPTPPHPGAYAQRTIALVPARGTIRYSSIEPDEARDDLLDAARRRFDVLQTATMYLLTADSGTTDDQFLVPVVDVPVLGAWVHAAVALTEAGPPASEHGYLGHVAFDLAVALPFAWVLALLLVLLTCPHVPLPPTLRHAAVGAAPAAWLAVAVVLVFRYLAREFAVGDWTSPTLVVTGLTLHAYIDLAAPTRVAAGPDRSRFALQWLWCALLCGAVLIGFMPALHPVLKVCAVVSAALGLAYLLTARFVAPWLPLPWRLHDDSHAHSHR